MSLPNQDPNVSDKSPPLAVSSINTLLSGGTGAGIPCDQFSQIQDDYLQKLQAKFEWMKKEGDILMNLRIGLSFVKDLDQRSTGMLSVNPTKHTLFGISCGLWLFPAGAEMVQGPFVCLLPMSVW